MPVRLSCEALETPENPVGPVIVDPIGLPPVSVPPATTSPPAPIAAVDAANGDAAAIQQILEATLAAIAHGW